MPFFFCRLNPPRPDFAKTMTDTERALMGQHAAYLKAERGPHPPSKTNGSGAIATQNPPFYYLFADIGYLVDHGGTTFGRLYSMRLTGVVLLVLTTIGAWLLAGEVFVAVVMRRILT